MNRDIRLATQSAVAVQLDEVVAGLVSMELPAVRQWVESKRRNGASDRYSISVSKLRQFVGLPDDQILIPQAGSKISSVLQRVSSKRRESSTASGANSSKPLDQLPAEALVKRLEAGMELPEPWKVRVTLFFHLDVWRMSMLS